ncbi:unnamed protein product [Rotaria sp. Silwood1]|nr:unnamed protein product [Rotaria sp. Silwood1]CAF1637528.1 unnamed protein product [Rotaria sp. Silwood1]CAF3705326.1 unnamed protein product [Rotaria sp. Silwood1]CAF3810768.1 unnamed protein product [Rotaria sp. Silwood1]CAF3903893.1 unnamed protein product [Rotaria sp. Silwood1]
MAGVRIMGVHERIGFAAHNEKKSELIKCLRKHRHLLAQHKLYRTGTTGSLIEKEFNVLETNFNNGLLGAKIATGKLGILIFLIDPLSAQPHEADIEALVLLTEVYNILCATAATSIDFILTSNNDKRTCHTASSCIWWITEIIKNHLT